MLYDDGRITCDETNLTIGWYYFWGKKTIPYSSIRTVTSRPMTRLSGKWRLWGTGSLRTWSNLDGSRSKKSVALELDTGGRVRPVITPDDPDAVQAIIAAHQER